jgi:hypothetical protein
MRAEVFTLAEAGMFTTCQDFDDSTILLSLRPKAGKLMTPVNLETVQTEQKTQPRPRSKRAVPLIVFALLILCGLAGAGYWVLHRQYVPPEAIASAERFLSLIKAGNFAEAYSLTTQDALPGRTLEQFESNVHHRLAVDALTSKVEWRGVKGGFQTYGNRIRRWLGGRKVDPDSMGLEFEAGSPVEVRVVSSPDGKWRITYFQTHAG